MAVKVHLVENYSLTKFELKRKMKISIETERLILREIEHTDKNDLYEMDADPAVHLYIENRPATSIDEVIAAIEGIKNQYKENGIARWAVVDKLTRECIGWAGLKFFKQALNNHSYFYELGYRFKKKHWGKGFATEASGAVLDYGFMNLNIDKVYAITDPENTASKKVLIKLGFYFKETFDYEGSPTDWFELAKENWLDNKCCI